LLLDRIHMWVCFSCRGRFSFLINRSIKSKEDKRICFVKLDFVAICHDMILALTNIAIDALSFSVILVDVNSVAKIHEFLVVFFVFFENINERVSIDFDKFSEFLRHDIHDFLTSRNEAMDPKALTFF